MTKREARGFLSRHKQRLCAQIDACKEQMALEPEKFDKVAHLKNKITCLQMELNALSTMTYPQRLAGWGTTIKK